MKYNAKTTTTFNIVVVASAIMIVSGLMVVPMMDSANALLLHDLNTKIKNFVKSVRDKVIVSGHGSPGGGGGDHPQG